LLFDCIQYNTYHEFVGNLYKCGSRDELANLILRFVPALIELDSAILLEFAIDGFTVRSGRALNLDPVRFADYSEYYQHNDLYKRKVAALPQIPAVEQACYYLDFAEWEHNEHRSMFLMPQGIYHMACLNIVSNNRLGYSISLHRSKSHSAFNERDIEVMRLLTPIIQAVFNSLNSTSAECSIPWLDSLTARERQILPMLLSNLPNDSIACHLRISANTLKTHIRHILNKSQCQSRFELVLRYGHAVSFSRDRVGHGS